MSLTTALKASLTSLKVVQDSIGVAANNIANVDTPGYIKQKTNQVPLIAGGVGQGVQIAGISTDVDDQLLKAIQGQISDLGLAGSLDEFFTNVQSAFGRPDTGNSLSDKLDDFFNAFQSLATNPDNVSLRLSALTEIQGLATSISNTASELQDLRLDADREIHNNVNTVNSLLDSLYNGNAEIITYEEGSSGRLGVEQQRTLNLQKLSEYVDISTIVDSDGVLSVLTKTGASLLDSTGVYHLKHTQAASADTFTNDKSVTAIEVARVENDGSLNPNSEILATSGKSSERTTTLQSGRLKGLIDLRDREIPKVIDQLDSFAYSFINAVNAIHNDGGAYPPPSSLTGTKATTSNTEIGWDGSVRIAVLNSDGSPASSPYTDETLFRPLTLDLSSLSGGTSAGRSTVQDVINEINQYYGPVQNRAQIGNLRDISLAVYPDTDSIADQGTVKFDLELDNTSAQSSSIVVNSVNIVDAGAYAGLTAPALPTTAYTVSAGGRERTNVPFTVDFSGGPNLASYTVRANVTVTDAEGNVSTADIDYEISDNVSNVRNDRYHATAVTGSAGTANFYAAPSSKSFLRAKLVDSNGNAVSAGEQGFLKIETPEGSNLSVVIDELDSNEKGLPSTASSNITNRGFSHYFELNNLFNSSSGVDGSAINMSLRSDIAANASLIATGGLQLSTQPDDPTEALYTYELASGSNSVANRLSDLRDTPTAFSSTSTLPAITTTFNSYMSDIVAYVATSSYNYSNNKNSEEVGLTGLQDILQKSGGVNTDEELARIVELENNYRASARVITVIKELFETLSQAVA